MSNMRTWLAAARDGEMEAMIKLHSTSAAPHVLCAARQTGVSSSGHTALHWAAAGGHSSLAIWLLSLDGTDVNALNNGGSSALHSAASNGNEELVLLLLRAGADASLTDVNGENAFNVAARHGHSAAAHACASPGDAAHVFLRISVAGKEVSCPLVLIMLGRHR